MSKLSKRTLIRASGWVALAATAALVGCGKKEEAVPAAAPASAPAAEAPKKPEPLKVAFAYVGPVGDAGWTFAHDSA
ncbi:MAG: BMP family ABC transporter substrate-binding protein, partial [Sphaerotilus sp.]